MVGMSRFYKRDVLSRGQVCKRDVLLCGQVCKASV